MPKTLPHTHEGMGPGIIYSYLSHSCEGLGTTEQFLKIDKKQTFFFLKIFKFFFGLKHSQALTHKPLKVWWRSVQPSQRKMVTQTDRQTAKRLSFIPTNQKILTAHDVKCWSYQPSHCCHYYLSRDMYHELGFQHNPWGPIYFISERCSYPKGPKDLLVCDPIARISQAV